MRKINEKQFRAYMKKELHYSRDEIEHTLTAVEEMEPEVLNWLLDWMEGKGYPENPVEGVTVRDLIEKAELSLNPVSAFLAVDWLKKEPEAAKYSLSRRPENLEIDPEVAKQMEEILGTLKNKAEKADGE